MTPPTPEQIKRLPAWARHLIQTLRGKVFNCERTLMQLKDSQTPSKAWIVDNTLEIGDRYYLPSDHITFELGEDTKLQVHVEDGRLEVTGIGLNCFLDINGITIGSIKR